jgi:hypothetical protein
MNPEEHSQETAGSMHRYATAHPQPETKQNTTMKPQISIVVTLDEIAISSPFSHSNNEVFREKGGRWDAKSREWIFERTPATEQMIKELFGEPSQLVNARVPLGQIEERYNQWKIGGYVVANRYKHDSPVETPLGVQLEKGHWQKTGGTTTEPRVTGDKDMSITVVMRRSFAERAGLEIIASEDQTLSNPLAEFGIRALIDELRRRGFNFGIDGEEGLPA